MKLTLFFALPTLALALPGFLNAELRGGNAEQQRNAEAPSDRSIVSRQDALGTLLGDVAGLLGSVASSVSPNNKRPEPGYVFQEPGPKDSRGPCPGLNLLANYGYLPRNGYVNSEQVGIP
jgi:hypothetical protein